MAPKPVARTAEGVKQGCSCMPGITKLSPADVTRNSKMFDECTIFNKRLIACQKQIQALKAATDGMVAVADKTLSAPMPQLWDRDVAGTIVPVHDPEATVLPSGALRRSTSLNLKQQVLDPISQWQGEYQKGKARMAQLHKAQLELDAARRGFYSAQKKQIKNNAKNANEIAAPVPQEMEDPGLIAARNKFATLEAAVHQELTYLVQRTRAVHRYLTRAMQLESQALQESAEIVQSEVTPKAVTGSPTAASAASPMAGGMGMGTMGQSGTPTSGFTSSPMQPGSPVSTPAGMTGINTGATQAQPTMVAA